ncbi:LPS export ABC transporter permease LptG [Bordetella holmesii]|uniref:LPS ABC transporter, permease protein LptG n=2 Tax=Bordetella holmesii TaxID=35814 RepID=A0A158M857_9BORD|nr:LPS export ABC transporter permease LptG [Bordetella holmesii]AHV94712.1 putative permease YjgP/YjgQ family protein [Bordetella holmesii ATCC 51541]AIT26626.1 putative permease YjgP/YjgQ family protein [Bordetella holmesii 44057]EWM44400.1 putative permease YjgP/YjgQ family protein [Bordetella holmesii 41130]EWM47210.1 putative permease YjgP/YjgQ family protein [Bordetella holmesii 35009]EWM51366.1 putative permease YjgP/YjgQ family protein [Bordetella holmesii 70147]
MRTARRYLAREIYRSCAVVLLALLGLFTFFALVDDLDNVGDKFSMLALLYMQALALPTRLYDLLPIGLLIGAILALAGLAQRNELVILRVSGVSGMRLMRMLWTITIPLMIGATLLSEYVTPIAEIKSGEADLTFRGKAGGGRLNSGYWFKEPTRDGGTRIINIKTLLADGQVRDVTLYELKPNLELESLSTAATGKFTGGDLVLTDVVQTRIDEKAAEALANAKPPATPPAQVNKQASLRLDTTLSPERLLARVLTPERMSAVTLLDYIDYLHHNQLQADRQIVALWRKFVYPFTLLVMITIAAPIAFMQTRRGGVGVKVFIGILMGVAFFMINQLSLNVGMLSRWPPWLTALGPNAAAMLLALGALVMMEYRHAFTRYRQQRKVA